MQNKTRLALAFIALSFAGGVARASDQNTNPGPDLTPINTDAAVDLMCWGKDTNLAPLVLSPTKKDSFFWLVGGQFFQHLNNQKFEVLATPHSYRIEGFAPRHLQGITYAAKDLSTGTWKVRLHVQLDEETLEVPCGAWYPAPPELE